MSESTLFSSGSELATLVFTSGILDRSRNAISDLYKREQQSFPFPITHEVKKQSDLTIIAFVTTPTYTQNHLQGGEAALVSSSDFKDKSFSFCTLKDQLPSLKKEEISDLISPATRLIITGHSLGGSIASLFTLLLLDSIDLSKNKRPLCITFGSPLIGDKSLQQAILEYSTWNSCFLHVASYLDPLPRLFISQQSSSAAELASGQTSEYKPFGTFLLCSEQGCSCFENPESILEFLGRMSSVGNPNQHIDFMKYEDVVKKLSKKAICEDVTAWNQDMTDPFKASIIIQLISIGLLQQQQEDHLIRKIDKQEKQFIIQKRKVSDPSKKLNDMKIYMAYLEWYKKESKAQEVGYYDSYKTENFASDLDVVLFKKILTNYWKDMVKVVESKPQKEGDAFRTRWFYGGTNYRRMVEPLDIAEYYKGNGTNYQNQGRSQHHKQLEKWLDEHNAEKAKQANKKPSTGVNVAKKLSVASNLTEDSCFWARVEEALISCKLLKFDKANEVEKSKLIEFENYVMESLNNYAVSPEIFLKDSSFMQWWREYKKIKGNSYDSKLAEFMKDKKYKEYEVGIWKA